MYYIVQENTFKEENYNNLIIALDRLKLPYEVVKVLPFIDDIKIKTKRKDIFPFGSMKLARVSKGLGWRPGSQMNDNHDYLVYREYYREKLLNWDSKVYRFGDEFFSKEIFFARPTKDTKVFTGKIFDMEQWRNFKESVLNNDNSTVTFDDGTTIQISNLLNVDTEIQISSIKNIQQEIRFWIVKGEVVTASQYRLGGRYCLNENIDQPAYDFCKKMVNIFQLNDAFVMDLCLVNGEYKIVECGCINCAGFYRANMQKLIMSLEDSF
jgi:hypothetical protein